MKPNIPTDFSKLQIEDSFLIRDRESITGNLCLDQAFMFIRSELKRDFKVTALIKTEFTKSGDHYQKFEIKTDACTRKQNELQARARIRLREVQSPQLNSCK